MPNHPAPRASVRSTAARGPGRTALRAARDAMYRSHLINAAERVFAEQGFDRARMQDVAAAAAVSLATLYRIFPHKRDLYRAIVDARGRELLEQVDLAMRCLEAAVLTPLGVVLHGVATHLRYFMVHPAFLKMSLLSGHLWYHSASRPSHEQEDQWTRGERLLESAFAIGARAGLFVVDDPPAQGRLMIALQQTRLDNWVLRGMQEPHDEVIAQNQAEFVRTFCRPSIACRVLSEDGQRVRPEALARSVAPDRPRETP